MLYQNRLHTKKVTTMFEDSQISEQQNGSQEMFGSQEPQLQSPATCAGCAENKILLQTILQELKDIKNTLADKGDSRFIVENSLIEAPLLEYLKKSFPRKLFLSDPDLELKTKVISLMQSLGLKKDVSVTIRSVAKHASRKFVDFWRQTKSKLLSSKKDIGNLCIPDLGRELFKKFTSDLNAKTEQSTLLLRAFCHEKKVLHKQSRASDPTLLDFWSEFRSFRSTIEEDQDPTKWEKIKQREERRIERYQTL